jgi:hypothetical protein
MEFHQKLPKATRSFTLDLANIQTVSAELHVMQQKRTFVFLVGGAFALVIALQLFMGLFFAQRPTTWKRIHSGMSREQAFNTLGKPTVDTADLKGQDTWRRVAMLSERTLIVRYDGSRAVEDVGERIFYRWGPMTVFRDIILFVIDLGLPIYLVARLGWRGVIAGAFCMWVTVYLSGEIQREGDPRADRFAMGVWIVVGLLFTIAYCAIVYGARQFVLFARARWGSLDVTKVRYRF